MDFLRLTDALIRPHPQHSVNKAEFSGRPLILMSRLGLYMGCNGWPMDFFDPFWSRKKRIMAIIKIPAARVQQGALVLYATSLKVKDLATPNFYSIETLDPADAHDKGYQRLLNRNRAKKLADYIVQGQDSQDAFLPTSVFLATDKPIQFNEH